MTADSIKLIQRIGNRTCCRNETYFTKRGTTLEAWRASAPRRQTHTAKSLPAPDAMEVCGAGDWVVMLDAGWADPSWQKDDNGLRRLRKRGVRSAVLVHDLIQIQNPEILHTVFKSGS